jgi:hypothetical protein
MDKIWDVASMYGMTDTILTEILESKVAKEDDTERESFNLEK